MSVKPRSINPGQKRKPVDPALAAVITRIIKREVERQLKEVRDEVMKSLEKLNKQMHDAVVVSDDIQIAPRSFQDMVGGNTSGYTNMVDPATPPYSTSTFTTVSMAQEQAVSDIENSTLEDDMEELMRLVTDSTQASA